MDYREKSEQLLSEIKNITGLTLSVSDFEGREAGMVELLTRFRDSLTAPDRTSDFLARFLKGKMSAADAVTGLEKLHMSLSQPYLLLLLSFPQPCDNSILEILTTLSAGSEHIVKISPSRLVLIRELKNPISDEMIRETALGILDILNADAMVSLKISYDGCVTGAEELPGSFRNASLAMTIGECFDLSGSVYCYHELGLGKLISRLSREDCREYLSDNLGDFDFRSLDNEMLSTIHALFDTNLNIAETARKLYVHRNTLVYRLDKFEKLSGLDLRQFDDAVVCKIAMLMTNLLNS